MTSIASFKLRKAYFGEKDALPFEMAAMDAEGELWVVLREAQNETPKERPLLPTYFEHMATVVRLELVALRALSRQLRFFHCAYEIDPVSLTVQWVFRDVAMVFDNDQYKLARWSTAEEAVQVALSEALSLSAPQRRVHP